MTTTNEDILTPLTSPIPLTPKCHHYSSISQVPKHLHKYFHQRYSLFSLYDSNIHLTNDAWFGVTPEPVAIQLSNDISPSSPQNSVLIDLFGGVGNNSISFALSPHPQKWSRIILIEKDISTLACAQHNASIYRVYDQITFVHGDCLDYLWRLKTDPERLLHPDLRVNMSSTTLFVSPPWGGVDYAKDEIFDLSKMEPYNLEVLHEACKPMEHALYLPRTSDLRQLAKLVVSGKQKMDVVQYCMEGASKALVAYVPAEGGYHHDDEEEEEEGEGEGYYEDSVEYQE
ncbi:RNA cap guanine-N2 methyltransferase-domain-containing protein [Podospora fimiseda]|uniref:Trimethylguanosine synthase n=1 Tax=Podospora fimiseda TaxID=252190 RepID=A0AAN7BVN2_9PEZI|nr:RNA cap guanine-N2 methyltransferase-domain-containing protein [Podospora fimiseda]